MNTILSVPRVAFMALALGTATITAGFAQTTNTPSTNAPTCSMGGWHHHHHESVLTAAEKAELKTAKTQALASNGTLQTQEAALKAQFATLKSEGDSATKADWQALHQQAETFHKNLKAAELLVDPNLAPVFAKLEAAHQNWHDKQ
jgi:hypothetical protein